MSTIEYVKYNTYRKNEFNLRTIIESVEGEKRVRKISNNSECNPFIKRIFNNYELLKSNYCDLNICNAYLESTSEISFDFLEGFTLTDILINFVNENNKNAFIELLNKFKSIILDNGKIKILKADNITEDFKHIFGDYIGEFPFNHMPITNIDMYFDNIIYNDNIFYLIDYEWVFDFPIPVKYVLFRSAICLYNKIGKLFEIKKLISLDEIFNLYEIHENDISTFFKMENSFSKYVMGENFINYNKFLKNNYSLEEIKNENTNYKIEISELKDKIINLDFQYKTKLSTLESQIVDLINSRNHYMSSYNDILNSTSWKTTKPLRFSANKMRKLNTNFKTFVKKIMIN